jgi:hypothetical protein
MQPDTPRKRRRFNYHYTLDGCLTLTTSVMAESDSEARQMIREANRGQKVTNMRPTKQPTTLKQMVQKIEAAEQEASWRKWMKKHPYSPEALAYRARQEEKAMARFEELRDKEDRRILREHRKKMKGFKITKEWLKQSFVVDPTVPGHLRLLDTCFDGEIREIRTRLVSRRGVDSVKWKVIRSDGQFRATMWSKAAIAKILS